MTDSSSPSFIFKLLVISGFFVLLLISCSPQIPSTQTTQYSTPTKNDISTTKTAVPVSTKAPSPTKTPNGCVETQGTVIEELIPSTILKEDLNFKVYLPPCYNDSTDARYPVLYMLHGQTSLDDQWMRLGIFASMDELLAEKKVQPFLIVLPNETKSNLDSFHAAYGDALVSELLPHIEENYRVCQDKVCRAIGGLSRGGNWAVHLGFEHPELFAAVGAHSAPLFYNEIGNILRIAGDEDAIQNLPVFYIDVGNKDEDLEDVQLFNNTLKRLVIQREFYLFQGYHDEEYWSNHVQDYLLWYGSQLVTLQPGK